MKWNRHDANLAFARGGADCLQCSSCACAHSTSSRVNTGRRNLTRSNSQNPRIGSARDRFFWAVKGSGLAFGMLALATTSGCLAMAAPLALNVARAAVSGISPSSHAAKNNQVAQRKETCDMAEHQLPQLVELRTDGLGTIMYRPLNLGGLMIDSQAQQGFGQPGAWRATRDLMGLRFQPPLQSQLAPSSDNFLAYAPAQTHDKVEQSQLEAFNRNFGTNGTFDWNNRVFLYAVVHQLPCESSRVPLSEQNSREPVSNGSPDVAPPMQIDTHVSSNLGKPTKAGPEQPEQPEQPRP